MKGARQRPRRRAILYLIYDTPHHKGGLMPNVGPLEPPPEPRETIKVKDSAENLNKVFHTPYVTAPPTES